MANRPFRGPDPVITLTETQFRALVKRVLKRLPTEIAKHLREVTVTVRKEPTKRQLADMGYEPDEALLGMYDGVPLPERSVMDPVGYPDIVYIFQDPLQEMCETLEELEDEVEITVAHEIGHYVGLSEERLEELGYG
jgi:predicted Zn-dependent protease with MMP-like domain